jgi:hypothetical protein
MTGNFWSRLRGARPKAISVFDGQEFKRAILAGHMMLEEQRDAINALNVFPVPDGDTGTNMALTMRAAVKEIAEASDTAACIIAEKLSRGALMGARGNSGVILSQILRGFSNGIDKKETLTASDFAAALNVAARMAYHAVNQPVEGTILTVVRESAEAAQRSAAKGADMTSLLGEIVVAARASVARTPDLLPKLKESGVVDSGGQGLTTILEGMWRHTRGESLQFAPRSEQAETSMVQMGRVTIEEEYGYEVVFLLRGDNLNLDAIRETITRMGGWSTVVAGDTRLMKVHTHTPTPGKILDYGIGLGSLSDVNIENLQEQSLRYAAESAREHGGSPPTVFATNGATATPARGETGSPTAAPMPPAGRPVVGDIATVVVAAGDGWTRLFESLGVATIIPGGQTMNPSTQDLLEACERVTASKVLLLPNNRNVILSANQVPQLAQKEVSVVPSGSLPQGVSALLAFNYDADFQTNCAAMTAALASVQTVEVTRAVRTVQLDGVNVTEGDIIGLVNDQLVASGGDLDAIVKDCLSRAGVERHEIVTLYYGADAAVDAAQALAGRIKEWFPGREVEVQDGGQPYYTYILSVE